MWFLYWECILLAGTYYVALHSIYLFNTQLKRSQKLPFISAGFLFNLCCLFLNKRDCVNCYGNKLQLFTEELPPGLCNVTVHVLSLPSPPPRWKMEHINSKLQKKPHIPSGEKMQGGKSMSGKESKKQNNTYCLHSIKTMAFIFGQGSCCSSLCFAMRPKDKNSNLSL